MEDIASETTNYSEMIIVVKFCMKGVYRTWHLYTHTDITDGSV